MKRSFLLFVLVLVFSSVLAQITSKREFRGTWIDVVCQRHYKTMSVSEIKEYFVQMLDSLRDCGINAVVFQVRPCADAFYYSEIEPWSRYLTGYQGKPPDENFDPMAFLIEEAHLRCMEFHAWINPYRVTISDTDILDSSHVYYKHPERFVKYGKQIYFEPGLPENRQFICEVVKDIAVRYDVDAIHMDDYFYPYPIAGRKFPDSESFEKYGALQGFASNQLGDWRRENINSLIREIKETIVSEKAWVRFGISPFGIYRNRNNTSDNSGSNTNGLQDYDDLYADVKLWMEKGWIDYSIPQLYWEIGDKRADYETLIQWWAKNSFGTHLYIGQGVARTMKSFEKNSQMQNQLTRKMELERTVSGIYGNCFWSAYELLKNQGGIADSLKSHYHIYPALIPAYLHLRDKRPPNVKSLNIQWTSEGYVLHWRQQKKLSEQKRVQYYVVYCFLENENVNLEDASKIVAVTRETFYMLPYKDGKEKYKYIVTSVDRFHNESKGGKMKKVKL